MDLIFFLSMYNFVVFLQEFFLNRTKTNENKSLKKKRLDNKFGMESIILSKVQKLMFIFLNLHNS